MHSHIYICILKYVMQVLWGRELRRCAKNPYPVAGDPYDAKAHNKWNRKKLHKLKAGSTIEYRPKSPCYCPPPGAAPVAKKHPDVWVKTKVLRVVRVGNVRPFDYTVPAKRCLHQDSVRCTARMVRRARRNNKLWGEALLPPATLKERHIVTPKTFDHFRDFIFSTDFVELLKARCITLFYLPVHCIRSLLLSSYTMITLSGNNQYSGVTALQYVRRQRRHSKGI